MNADAILAIPDTQPERLFKDQETISQERKALLKQWHPDLNKHPRAADVSAHISILFDAAEAKIAKGEWHTPGLLKLYKGKGTAHYLIKYQSEIDLQIGRMYVGKTTVAFVIDRVHADLVDTARVAIHSLKYPDDKVRKDIERFMPVVAADLTTPEYVGFVLKKTEDVLLLRDIHSRCYGGKTMDPKHVAWIISRLMNLNCYLFVSGQTHLDISPDTVFISPPHHSASLLGGWFYHHDTGKKLKAAPSRTVNLLPPSLLKDKVAQTRMNGEQVKALGRELLGDITGTSLRMNKEVPQALSEWLMLPASDNAIEDYKIWYRNVLEASFGVRRFVEMKITADTLYN